MALNDTLIKVSISNLDTKGIYLKDANRLFRGSKSLSKKDLEKINYEDFDLVIKLYFRNKQMKKTLHFSSITALQAVKKAILIRHDFKETLRSDGQIKPQLSSTLNVYWDEYLQQKSSSLDANNIYSMRKTYDKWIAQNIGDLNITEIITTDIQNIVNSMLRQGLAPRTTLSIKQILRPLFNYAIENGLIENNPALKVSIPKFDNTVNFDLSEQQHQRLKEEMLNYEVLKYRGIMLFLYLGRRLNEVLTLKWEQVDLLQKTYTVDDIYSKIRRKQTYPLSPVLETLLSELGVRKRGYVFQGEKTLHVTSSTFRRHWKIMLSRADIEHMRIHDTRHLLGNTMVNRGESLESIGAALGHSSVAVTKRYSKTSLQTVDNLLNSYF